MPEGLLLTAIGTLGIFAVVGLYPALLIACSPRRPADPPSDPDDRPSVVIITAARNAATLLPAKIENFRTLDYPAGKLILLIASDASTDETRAMVEGAADPRIRLVEQTERGGKAAAMNLAVEHTDSDLLLFSDADALLSAGSVWKMARYFSDPAVGGVCGLRVAARSGAGLRDAQQTYINLDSRLRLLESAHGRITSNDGKIHMIRRELYAPVPRDVSDDLYTLLSVVSQGFRYLFEPAATAEVAVPARDAQHEIERRHRIVILSLTGIFRVRQVLNPFRFGLFSIGLWINKIGRRLLPFFCLALATGLFVLVGMERGLWIAAAALLAAVVYGLAAALTRSAKLNKPIRLMLYILAGFIGTAWAVIGFICGQRISSWEPKKAGGRQAGMNDTQLTVAYLMSRFPKLTETFVLYEMLELRRLGFQVIVIPLRLEKEGASHPEVQEMKDQIFPAPLLSPRTVGINLKWLFRHPVRYVGTALRAAAGTFGGDIKFFLSSIVYFPKAVVFADTVQRLGVSHVHAHFANHPSIVAWMMHQLCGISYSFTAHGNDLHIDQRMLREKARDAALAVTISDFNIRFIEERCGKETADQFEVIHCGADLSAFKPVKTPKPAGSPFEIICVASFQVRKGHKILIDACAQLRERGLDFRCRLVGYGECEQQIRKQIQTLGLNEHVILEGAKPKPDVVRLLNAADVLVLTSFETRAGRKEGIPVALMEGMASGLPVVSSHLSGIPELVEDGVCGLLFPPADASAAAAALERLANDPELRARMGRAARARVEEAFDLAENARTLAGRIQEKLRA